MTGTYNLCLVLLSILVAVVVSHTALRLAARVARARGSAVRLWLTGGAIAMGTGIWAMHFIGMLAFTLPIALSYNILMTLGSLVLALASSGFALTIASKPDPSLRSLISGAVIMGAGICAMHYLGMTAVQIVPMIRYEPWLVAASAVIAVLASFGALWLFTHPSSGTARWARPIRIGSAFAMGAAISGMHYTAMAASRFAANSYCVARGLGGPGMDARWLAVVVAALALGLLAIVTILLVYDTHLESNARRYNDLLEQANAKLRHAATHDSLTDLPNRVLLAERLNQAIARATRHSGRFAVLVVDLDRFKAINDSLGHIAGDELLQEVARRLSALLRREDTLARLGGDEFVLVVDQISSPQDAEVVARKVLAEVALPTKLQGLDVHVSPSVGISVCPDDGADAETLLQHADAAMYDAKKKGRNTFQFFAPAMNAFARERLELESGLRNALAQREFELHFQPKVDIASGHIESAEALIRWRHPKRGLIPPGGFIPLAEETGLIVPIGRWVLAESCRQVHVWNQLVPAAEALTLHVNMSARQLQAATLTEDVAAILGESGFEPRNLVLEITEGVLVHDPEAAIAKLNEIKRLGVRLAIDDFGTGYSSLSYLQRFPIDILKIDKSFVDHVTDGGTASALARAIVKLGPTLGLEVVAEGIETAEQAEELRALQCDQGQGYYFSHPLPAEDLGSVLAAWTASMEADRLAISAGPLVGEYAETP